MNKEQSLEAYGQLPLAFEANRGQSDGEVRFISRGSGYGLFLTSTEAVLALRQPPKQGEKMGHQAALTTASKRTRDSVLRLKLVGANATPQVMGMDELPGKANYFIGNDSAKWRTDIPTYQRVMYREVYPGVDMIYYGNQRQLEYDLVVAPGADPNVIALRIEGSKAKRLNAQGDLALGVEGGDVVMRKPDIYQEIDGVRHAVQGNYTFLGKDQVGFRLGDYDMTKPVVIDPALVYSTYLGGGSADWGYDIAVDGAGSAYVTGVSFSSNFPIFASSGTPYQTTFGGVQDAFVAKLNATGTALLYSTYVGGSNADVGRGIALDSAGNAYITGQTQSSNFPVLGGCYQTTFGGSVDVFVAKLNATGGVLIYGTYLGGSQDEVGAGIAVDNQGNAYITGNTFSGNFPTTSGSYQTTFGGGSGDVFVTKLNATGTSLIYSTYVGGNMTEGGYDIALDNMGNAYVAGQTEGNFPTIAGSYQTTYGGGSVDAFVAKLNATGSALLYSTYLGGNNLETGYSIAVDGASNAYVTGDTMSGNFPVTPGTLQTTLGSPANAFVTKLNATGAILLYSTYVGGASGAGAFGIALDNAGNAYVTGGAPSGFPTTVGAYQASLVGIGSDAFVAKLDASGGTLLYSTYLGGSQSDWGYGIAVDSAGSVYVAGVSYSSNFPIFSSTGTPYQTTFGGGGNDGFVAKFSILDPCVAPPNTTMVAWYPFDENVGTTASNLATGNTGTLINSPTHIPGKVAGALRFDGSNDYVDSPSTIVTNIGPAGLPQTCLGSYSTCRGDFSIDAWIKVDPTAALAPIMIVDKRSGSVPTVKGYSFFVYQRNKLGLQLADGVGSAGFTNYLSPVITGLTTSWHHVAVTVSRRSFLLGIKWYDNGVNIGFSSPLSTRYGSLVNNSPLRIGASSLSSGWFKGDIDEVEIFNRALSPNEVQKIYNAKAGGKCK